MGFYDFYAAYAAELWLLTLLLILVLLAGLFAIQQRVDRLHSRYRTAMAGRDGDNLEDILVDQTTRISSLAEKLAFLSQAHAQTRALAQAQSGRVGVVRYNPFKDSGGDQSFAVAWINTAGHGVVISSLHSREGTRVYAKPLTAGESRYTLTDEERLAIELARKSEIPLATVEL